MLEAYSTIMRIKQSMMEWTSIRQDEDDRIRSLAKLVQPALHRWDANGPYSKHDADYVHEQVAKVVSILNESSELGKRNNEKFAKLGVIT